MFKVSWSLVGEQINLELAAQSAEVSQTDARQLFRAGVLGPAPDVGTFVTKLPLFHVVALHIFADARRLGVSIPELSKILPTLASSAFIELQRREIQAGRCGQRGGTPLLNQQLWAALRSEKVTQLLSSKLPSGSENSSRYARFGAEKTLVAGCVSDLEELPGSYKDLDGWAGLGRLKQNLRGTLLATHIG